MPPLGTHPRGGCTDAVYSHPGSFREQASFLRRQFLQDGELPFISVVTEAFIARALSAVPGWLDCLDPGDALTDHLLDTSLADRDEGKLGGHGEAVEHDQGGDGQQAQRGPGSVGLRLRQKHDGQAPLALRL